jgi:hypothetical protein
MDQVKVFPMDSVKIVERFKMPDPVYLSDATILEKWAGQMQEVGEMCLYPAWRASIKLGGILYRKILQEDPYNKDISDMKNFSAKKKVKEEGQPQQSSNSSDSSSPSSGDFSSSSSSKGKDEVKDESAVILHLRKEKEERKAREKEAFHKNQDEELAKLEKRMKAEGEDDRTIQDTVKMLREEQSKAFLKKRLEEREVIDLTKIDTAFSQSGIVSDVVQKALGLGEWEMEREFLEEKFFRFDKREWEAQESMPGRKAFWDFMVKSVVGVEKNLFCSHLVKQSDKYDVAYLFKLVSDFLIRESFQTIGKRVEEFFRINPFNNEDIFLYISRVRDSVKKIERSDHVARSVGESVQIPKFFILWKILGALPRYPQYGYFLQKILLEKPENWFKMSVEELTTTLHQIHANSEQLRAGGGWGRGCFCEFYTHTFCSHGCVSFLFCLWRV